MWQCSVVDGRKRKGGKLQRESRRVGLVVLAILFGTTSGAVIIARSYHVGAAQTLVAVLVGGGTLAGLYLAWVAFRTDLGKDAQLSVAENADELAIAAGARGASGPDALSGGAAAPTRTLPRDIAAFTGRKIELQLLQDQTSGTERSGGVVQILTVGGMAGVGKTTFAVHAAHRLAPMFPDGQIFLALNAHTPGMRPIVPSDALASLLLTVGVAAQKIPPGLEARTSLWRAHLAGKRILLVLDDATGHEQVRPLLPSVTGSLVLVTSRRHLTALEDAQAINLDVLPAAEAAELLIRLAARPGLNPDDPAVEEIARLCGYLPLAVGMLGRQLTHHPAWTTAELAADLVAARDRLALMHAENLSVAAAFDLSYRDLTAEQQQLFRRLALHPGTDIDAYAAAAVGDADLGAAPMPYMTSTCSRSRRTAATASMI
jgi:NB-ARC domain